MNKDIRSLCKLILPVQSVSYDTFAMEEIVTKTLRKEGFQINVDYLGNIYATKGQSETYPCIVAHLDTVHGILPEGRQLTPVYSPDNNLVTGFDFRAMQQAGIGGDDKCGIIAALAVARNLDAVKLAFFVDEEVGCVGSNEANLSFFKDCRFVLQADRRGSSDFVTDIGGSLSSRTFQKAVRPYLKEHGFKRCHGMMSDVMALRDNGVGISVANMSAGYYNPHSNDEYVDIPALVNTASLMLSICRNLTASFPYDAPPRVNWWSSPKSPGSRGVPPINRLGDDDEIINRVPVKDGWDEAFYHGGDYFLGEDSDIVDYWPSSQEDIEKRPKKLF